MFAVSLFQRNSSGWEMNFSAVILAGGKSSRMGRDKAWLEFRGHTLLARQIGIARETGAAEIMVSGRAGGDYSAFGCRILLEKIAARSPPRPENALNRPEQGDQGDDRRSRDHHRAPVPWPMAKPAH